MISEELSSDFELFKFGELTNNWILFIMETLVQAFSPSNPKKKRKQTLVGSIVQMRLKMVSTHAYVE